MKNFFYTLFLAAAVLLLGGGCRTFFEPEGIDGNEQLPWNAPAGWEGDVIGVPY